MSSSTSNSSSTQQLPQPKFKIDTDHSSDLLRRISAFLPQIHEANQNIQKEQSQQQQIDVNLTVDNDDSDSDSDTDKNSETDNLEDSLSGKPPQIELKVALGNIDKNTIAILDDNDDGNDNEKDKDCGDTKDEEEDTNDDQRRNMIESLLSENNTVKKQNAKKVLIEEIN